MTDVERTRAIHTGGDVQPDDKTADVFGFDGPFCDACPGKRSHTRECPVAADIRRRAAEQAANWRRYRRRR
jgi:hypothetical protein